MTRERRFLVDALTERVELRGEEAHHLLHVLRLGVGDAVVLFDGRGNAKRAVVTARARSSVSLEALDEEPSRESPLPLAVGVAVLKADRMAIVVQKLTELGVSRVLPLLVERGDVPGRRASGALERWRRIALEASKQSGRSRLPEVAEPVELSRLLEETPAGVNIFMAHPGAPPLALDEAPGELLALVGPEGGFSPSEVAHASSRGASLFGLGPRTLRAETAAIAVATLFQFAAGDLGS